MLADEMPPADWHWDHVSLDELRDALKASYPDIPSAQIETLVLTLWARVIAKRVGVHFQYITETRDRRGY